MVIGFAPEHTERVLLKSIQEIADEPVTLVSENQGAESANTHWLGATADERSDLSVDQVVSAFLETAGALQHRVRTAGGFVRESGAHSSAFSGPVPCSVVRVFVSFGPTRW